MKCKHLTGDNIKPGTAAEARKLVGKTVNYLRDCDIDKSGRGYIFIQRGEVETVHRSYIRIGGYLVSMRDIVDMTEYVGPREWGVIVRIPAIAGTEDEARKAVQFYVDQLRINGAAIIEVRPGQPFDSTGKL